MRGRPVIDCRDQFEAGSVGNGGGMQIIVILEVGQRDVGRTDGGGESEEEVGLASPLRTSSGAA